jgi:transcription antitermination factor NusG
MASNWYAVYTQSHKERKVSSLLTKKGIENFCPVTCSAESKSNSRKPVFEALFNSYVFVYITEAEVSSLRLIPGVINVIYWKSKPAVINKEEIDLVKQLTTNYSNIRLEKSFVDVSSVIKIIDEPQIAFNENTVSVKYNRVKVNLPSLGFIMIAERMKKKEEAVYQQPGLFSSFPQKINALFFN